MIRRVTGPATSTRRHYLRGVGGVGGLGCVAFGGLVGCVGRPSDDTDGDGGGGDDGSDGGEDGSDGDGSDDLPGDGDDADGTRPSGTGGPGVTLVAVDDAVDLPVEPSVEVVREAATEDHPPRLRTTLSNAGEEPVRVGEGRAVHFEYVVDDDGLLTLLPPDDDYPAEPDCWRLEEAIATTEEYRTFEIGAGESSRRAVDLYATAAADGCLPVGEYRFETVLSVLGEGAEPEASARWGFSILLE
ncbi:hypothetical protein [Halorubrum halodurans]|uniref:Intracellular proteinase inhibitor BsuPI domain-containing protein n=1 Tax=Halorubrum halodurans TaxID=1383851 RepID=A0A256IBL0_9EURY|nr:hypothetical protein [Halorubrum halodurans]OYR53562.1 hypothetical protein DJ70_16235 [Halorubrum halodurans]